MYQPPGVVLQGQGGPGCLPILLMVESATPDTIMPHTNNFLDPLVRILGLAGPDSSIRLWKSSTTW
jgi:hypothetical protein